MGPLSLTLYVSQVVDTLSFYWKAKLGFKTKLTKTGAAFLYQCDFSPVSLCYCHVNISELMDLFQIFKECCQQKLGNMPVNSSLEFWVTFVM